MDFFRSIYDGSVQWFCDKVWTKIDPQTQYLGVQFDVTNACNLRCTHCYHPHHINKGALTYPQWLQVLDQYGALLKKLYMKPDITICGGEPLSWPHLSDFIDEIRLRFGKCPLGLLSNGTILTPRISEKLKAENIRVQISVDGPDIDRHELIRGKGSFQKMLNGCQLLREHGVPFHHLAVLSNRTSRWIEDFFRLPSITGASEMNFVRLIVEGNARTLYSSGSDMPLEGPALRDAMRNILRFARLYGVATATGGELWHLVEEGLGSPNNIGIAGFVVDYKGGFKVSSRTSAVLGSVFEVGMEKLFLNHPTMVQLRKGNIAICGECKYFNRCRGSRNVSFASFGHFFGPDTGCWVLPQHENSMVSKETEAPYVQ